MAWSTSNGNAYYTFAMGTNGVKPSADAFKVALYTNSVTPAQSATAANTQYGGGTWAGNEITGTGYTSGGVSITSPTWTQASNTITFTSAGTPTWTSSTFTAYGCLPYDTTNANQAISWNYFGGAQTVTAGTFTITWNAAGVVAYTH